MGKPHTLNRGNDEKTVSELLKLDQGVESLTIDQFQYLRHIYKQLPVGISLSIFCSAFATWLFWTEVPHFLLIPWLAFIGLTSSLQLLLVNEFKKSKSHIGASGNWSVYNTFLCAVIAMSWGAGSLLFFPYLNTELHLVYLGILICYVIAWIPVLAALYSGYMLFISIIAFSLLLCLLFQPVTNKGIVILALAGIYVFIAIIAAYFNRSLLGTFKLATSLKDNFHYLYELNEVTQSDNVRLKKKISEELNHHEKLKSEKEHAEVTLQAIGEGVITTDTEGYVIYINPVAEILTGWSTEKASGLYVTEIFSVVDEISREILDDPVRACLTSNNAVISGDHTILARRDKLEYCIEYSVTPIRNRNDISTCTVLVFRDVTDKRNLARDLVWQASHDALTGLINRREFENRLLKLISSSKTLDRQHALCFIDLDQFKIVNDSCGHLAGDSLLEKIAKKLRSKTRESDTLARLGGDEFGVILYSCSMEKAKLIAESFRKQIEEIDFIWDDKHFNVGISVGIVPITKDTDDISELLQLADMACYMAKDAGRNQVHIYDEQDQKGKQRRGEMHWIDDIQDALEREKFVLYVQPIKSLNATNKTSVCELLLRMKSENNPDICADRFLKTAERYHLMPKLDKWAIKACFELLSYGHPVLDQTDIVSINISGQSIADPRITGYIIDQAREYAIDANKVCFEIEETTIINNPLTTRKFIADLYEHGFHFALDNFSFGLNILSQLNKLNFDYIKINGRLSDDTSHRIIDTAAIESVNKLCHLLGTKTVAKFVTDDENLKSLEAIGIDYIQGYIIARPKPLAKEE
ncbi:MAG: diguanylate cyclase/phosphodiesterase with PAS/PAC sensor(s) [Gammaproteobacteria bacterium]|nr:diguanylate cyclase/phosphodiesterase with PAS/PAC sensor(s) [Gammaproteobacteria bacterium]